jgi:hypothetical protein
MTTDKENNHLEDWEESIVELAKELHYKYEEFAEQEKWSTNYFCNKMPFDSLPIKNQRVMLRMADLVNSKFKESQKGMIKIEDVKKWFSKLPYDNTLKTGEVKRWIITKEDIKKLIGEKE